MKLTWLKYSTGQVGTQVLTNRYLYELVVLQEVQLLIDTEQVKHMLLQPIH